jgi:carbonic anhydrase
MKHLPEPNATSEERNPHGNDRYLGDLFASNRRWAASHIEADPEFFLRLANQQFPKYLWIGCADSRVPANEIVGLLPGEMFVHRNVANVVVHSDMNCLSVLQFAIEILRIEHVIVVGHYGCGGIAQTLKGGMVGVADNWLRHVQDVQLRHAAAFENLSFVQQHDLLCELNVIEQVRNVCRTTFVRDAWTANQPLTVHGWTYGLSNGLINDLGWSPTEPADLERGFAEANQRAIDKAAEAAKAGAA